MKGWGGPSTCPGPGAHGFLIRPCWWQVLLPQMQLLVLIVPQVRPLVLRRRVFYHATYFAFAIRPPDRLSNNVLARICSSISRTSISASLYMFLSGLPV